MASKKRQDLNETMEKRFKESMAAAEAAKKQNDNAFVLNTSNNNPEAEASSDKPGDWSIEMPNDVKDVGTEVYAAPTKNPKRPRAHSVAYNHNTKTVIIAMRSGVWWQYNDVSTEIWLGLKNSGSTNEYLPVLEAACSGHHEASMDALSAGTKERISHSAATASRMQSGKLPTWDDIFLPPRE